MIEPAEYWRTAKETLWPLRAGNSAKLAFVTLKVVGGFALWRALKLVNVKKSPSTLVTFGGTKKSEVISASPAITI